MNKIIVTAILGFLLACSGGYLRLQTKSLSMYSVGTYQAVDSSGKTVGPVTWRQEDASHTAARTDIALALLFGGSALFVVAAAAWLFVPVRKMEHEKSIAS
jgi:hypothetical protein